MSFRCVPRRLLQLFSLGGPRPWSISHVVDGNIDFETFFRNRSKLDWTKLWVEISKSVKYLSLDQFVLELACWLKDHVYKLAFKIQECAHTFLTWLNGNRENDGTSLAGRNCTNQYKRKAFVIRFLDYPQMKNF